MEDLTLNDLVVYTGYFNAPRLARVTRLTETLATVVLKDFDGRICTLKFSRKTGYAYGGGYYKYSKIYKASAEEISKITEENEKRRLLTNIKNALNNEEISLATLQDIAGLLAEKTT